MGLRGKLRCVTLRAAHTKKQTAHTKKQTAHTKKQTAHTKKQTATGGSRAN